MSTYICHLIIKEKIVLTFIALLILTLFFTLQKSLCLGLKVCSIVLKMHRTITWLYLYSLRHLSSSSIWPTSQSRATRVFSRLIVLCRMSLSASSLAKACLSSTPAMVEPAGNASSDWKLVEAAGPATGGAMTTMAPARASLGSYWRRHRGGLGPLIRAYSPIMWVLVGAWVCAQAFVRVRSVGVGVGWERKNT